jgi:hypothetical protein
MTFKSYLLPAFQGRYALELRYPKGIPMKTDLIDRWVDHKWKESLAFDFGRYRNRFAGVNQLGVVF